MTEPLLASAAVVLFGRVLTDLKIDKTAYNPPPDGGNEVLLKRLAAAEAVAFARIYGFGYEGHYYDLARPALFLVEGEGKAASECRPAHVGVVGNGSAFDDGMKAWTYDKDDVSVRLNVESGPLERILLSHETDAERLRLTFGGSKAQLHGSSG